MHRSSDRIVTRKGWRRVTMSVGGRIGSMGSPGSRHGGDDDRRARCGLTWIAFSKVTWSVHFLTYKEGGRDRNIQHPLLFCAYDQTLVGTLQARIESSSPGQMPFPAFQGSIPSLTAPSSHRLCATATREKLRFGLSGVRFSLASPEQNTVCQQEYSQVTL